MTLLDGTDEITELEKISPERVDGVGDPASGFPILMLKMTAPEATQEAPPVTVTATEAEPQAAVQQEAAKAAAAEADQGMVTVELPADMSLSISPRDLAKLATLKQQLALKEAAAKRDMDPAVGGGVDRDKLKPGDFVFPGERDFPVVIPGDVPDAVSSWGRYKGKHTFAQFKAALSALAHRKGVKFVAELPKDWTEDDDAASKARKPKGKGKKPFPGAAPPFKAEGEKDDAADGEDAEKAGGKPCKCGSAMAKDAKFCSQCGKPAAGDADDGDSDEDDDTSDNDAAKSASSPQDAKVDDALGQLAADADAALAAQDADPDNETHPADQAVQAHLEDARDSIAQAAEAQQADEATDDPAAHGMAAAKSAAAAGDAPYHLARLHDATCAAFRHDDVVIRHPVAAKGIGHLADPAPFGAMVSAALAEDAGTGSRAAELPALSAAYQAAIALKSLAVQEGLLDGAMEGIRKAFTDAYPDAHPTPGSITPGQFKRPYIGAGHANQAAGPSQKPRIPLASHVPDPADFRRPLLTSGHEAAAPGSSPAGVGKARTYYSNAGKQEAVQVLGAMHDYIAGQHPDLCPMAGATYDGEQAVPGSMGSSLTTATPAVGKLTPNQATSVPVPVTAGAQSAATTKAAGAAGEEPAMAPEATTQAPVIDRDLLKSVLSEVVSDQLGDVIKAIGEHGTRLAELESAPDTAQMAPRSGMAKAATAAQEVPAGGDGREVERLVRLVKRAKDPDPQVRDEAMGELFKAVGREDAVVLLAS